MIAGRSSGAGMSTAWTRHRRKAAPILLALLFTLLNLAAADIIINCPNTTLCVSYDAYFYAAWAMRVPGLAGVASGGENDCLDVWLSFPESVVSFPLGFSCSTPIPDPSSAQCSTQVHLHPQRNRWHCTIPKNHPGRVGSELLRGQVAGECVGTGSSLKKQTSTSGMPGLLKHKPCCVSVMRCAQLLDLVERNYSTGEVRRGCCVLSWNPDLL
jgi:hypothetical protein